MKTDNSKFDQDGKLKHGVHQQYFKNGSLSGEGIFKDGEKNGEWKCFLANGQLKAIEKYTKVKMIGEWKWYCENGDPLQMGSIDNDIKTGVWTRYQEDGTLMDETRFTDGKKGKVKSITNKKQRSANIVST